MVKRIGVLAVAMIAASCSRGPAVDTQQLNAVSIAGALPADDPSSPAWQSAPQFPATLMIQDVTEPRLERPGVGLVQVQALHDGKVRVDSPADLGIELASVLA